MKIDAARVLGDWLDREGGWDWTDGAEHDPSDRLAVVTVRRLGAPRVAALVYRGTEGDTVKLFGTRDEAATHIPRPEVQL